MSDTIDHQLEHLSELHADGALTDDEFATAKAHTLGSTGATPSGASPAAADPILAAPAPNIPPNIVWFLLVFGAFIIGATITGMSAGFEWAPAQAPAAPIVCPGGKLVVGFDVSYSVAAKGVDLASVCVKNGSARQVSDLWLSTVMTLEYTAIFLVIFVGWRSLYLRRARDVPVTNWSADGTTSSGGADDA
jgi:Short C-terminal domain